MRSRAKGRKKNRCRLSSGASTASQLHNFFLNSCIMPREPLFISQFLLPSTNTSNYLFHELSLPHQAILDRLQAHISAPSHPPHIRYCPLPLPLVPPPSHIPWSKTRCANLTSPVKSGQKVEEGEKKLFNIRVFITSRPLASAL